MNREAYVLLAVVRRARGLRGEVVVSLEGSEPERFSEGLKVWLWPPDAGAPPRQTEVEKAWVHNSDLVLQFRGIDDRTGAEALRGFEIRIPEEERPPVAEGEHYLSDLIGCQVVAADGTEIGVVTAWQDFGAAPLLTVQSGDVEHLIPWVKGIYTAVDLDARRIVVELPEGLLELNTGRA